MKINRYRITLLFLLLFLGSQPAGAWEVYKYRMPDGSVAYTHEVSTTGKLEEIIGAPPADSAQVEQALRVKHKREEEKINRIASQREADLNAVDAEIPNGTTALETAKRNLKSGMEPRPGEILGTASRRTLLSLDYWRRVRELVWSNYSSHRLTMCHAASRS